MYFEIGFSKKIICIKDFLNIFRRCVREKKYTKILFLSLSRPIFRKCFHTAYYYLDYPPRNVPTLQEWENSEQDGERTAVAVQQFVQHVASLHADGDIGFSKEYELIQSETGDYTVENSQFAENKAKNRYLNILACK